MRGVKVVLSALSVGASIAGGWGSTPTMLQRALALVAVLTTALLVLADGERIPVQKKR